MKAHWTKFHYKGTSDHATVFKNYLYGEDFYFVDQFHGSALHSNQCTTGCEAHMNSANESACLISDNVQNVVVTIHKSQKVLKMLSLHMYISFAINCFIKKQRSNNPSCTYSTPDTNFNWTEQNFLG
jgi:hypothetical protein